MIVESKNAWRESGRLGAGGLLVVAENGRGEEFASWIRSRYPGLEVRCCAGFVDAIAEVCERPVGRIVAMVEGGATRWEDAVAGVREASGAEARIVLCCEAEWEPLARRVVGHGADDYLLMPFVGTEFDELLALQECQIANQECGMNEAAAPSSETVPPVEGGEIKHVCPGADMPPIHGRGWKELEESLREWKRLALTDECTGLANRRALWMELKEILRRAEAERLAVTVLVFDVDDFKSYNDTHGHGAGDELLRLIGGLIRTHCREQDVVARYGGDEFVVVFWDAEGSRIAGSKHPGCAMDVLTRFEAALKCHGETLKEGRGAALSVSGGLATYPWDARSAEELIERADQALLSAKRAGKNRIFVVGGSETGMST